MLKKVIIENYRGFEFHEINYRNLNIIVGKNNAGKTSLIEALRLLSLVTNRYKTAPYKQVPNWLDIGRIHSGIKPSLKRIDFSYKNIFHSYNDPPAKITGVFYNDTKILIYFAGEDKFHAIIYDSNGKICSKSDLNNIDLPIINILPQIRPLLVEEKVLAEEYVKLNIDSSTSSRHFRNQLGYLHDYYKIFKNLVENTWNSIKLLDFNSGDRILDKNPYQLIQEGTFATEIGYMGHGLQMWLQTMWFLARCDSNSTIILDEPDVYMHADLQRKLIRLLVNKYKQVVVTTHSVEIMSEVEPENMIIIDKNKKASVFASDFSAVQKVLSNIGSIHNVALSRLWSANKLLIVEGKDIEILKRIQNKLFCNSNEPFEAIPNMSIGGWGGWNRAVGSRLMLKNAGDENITIYCILDSDYHTEDEIKQRLEKARKNGIYLKIWSKKEIENYLINFNVIKRMIEKNSDYNIHKAEVEQKLEELVEELKDDYLGHLMDKIQLETRQNGKSLERANERLKILWKDKYSVVSGKKLIKKISNWTNDYCNVTLNSNKLAQEFAISEIPEELKETVNKIENKQVI